MALFEGEELVDVDVAGRKARVPVSVAASLGLPSGVQAPPVVDQPPVPVLPTPTDAGAPPPKTARDHANVSIPTNTVGQPPAPVLPTPPDAAPAPAPAPAPQRAAPPQDKRAKASPAPDRPYAGALAEQQAALGARAQAGRQAAQAEAAAQLEQASAYDQERQRIDANMAAAAKAEADHEAALAKKQAEADAIRKKIASTKIDRKGDHEWLGLIGMILSGFGSAMKREGTNPAVDAYYKSIDRKVAAQEADLDRLGKTYGMAKDDVDALNKQFADRTARRAALNAAATDRFSLMLKEVASRSNSEIIKARADEAIADLQLKSADYTMQAADRQVKYDTDKAQLAAQERASQRSYAASMAATNQRAHEARERLKFDREKLDADLATAIANANKAGETARAKMLAERSDKVREVGIRSLPGAAPLLNAPGKAMMAEADKLEADAKKFAADFAKGDAKDKPEAQAAAQQRYDAMLAKASDLRANAVANHSAMGRDASQAGKLSTQYASAQNAVTLIDDINRLWEQHGKSYFDTDEGRAAMQAKSVELLMSLKNVWQLGVLSRQDTSLVMTATGGDPTNGWEVGNIAHNVGLEIGKDPEAFRARLESLSEGMQKGVINELRVNTTWDGGAARKSPYGAGEKLDPKDSEALFFRAQKPSAAEQKGADAVRTIGEERTTEEVATGARRGAVGEAVYTSSPGTIAFIQGPYAGVQHAVQPVTESFGYNVDNTSAAREERVREGTGHFRYPGMGEKQGEAFDVLMKQHVAGDAKATERIKALALDKRESLSQAVMQALRNDDDPLYAELRPKVAAPVAERLAEQERFHGRATQPEPRLGDLPPDITRQFMTMPLDKLAGGASRSIVALEALQFRAERGEPGAAEMLQAATQKRATLAPGR